MFELFSPPFLDDKEVSISMPVNHYEERRLVDRHQTNALNTQPTLGTPLET